MRLAWLLGVLPGGAAFDQSKFRTCRQSTFCEPFRPPNAPPARLEMIADTLAAAGPASWRADVWQPDLGANSSVELLIEAHVADDAAAAPLWRVQLATSSGPNAFRIAPHVLPLRREPPTAGLHSSGGAHTLRAVARGWWSEIELNEAPLTLSLYAGEEGEQRTPGPPLARVGSYGLLRLSSAEPRAAWRGRCDAGADSFGERIDGRPFGCTAATADVDFPRAEVLYGLPERAAGLAVAPTLTELSRAKVGAAGSGSAVTGGRFIESTEPHRLFNLDVFRYDRDTPIGLYGAVPYVLAHGGAARAGTAAAVWINAADTYVDTWRGARGGMGTHWSSEGGAIDLALLPGPSAAAALRQLAALGGTPPMPPLWAQGYHASHWNLRTQSQLAALDSNADRYGSPLDGLWLDIEHTRGKRYFTWDRRAFPSPHEVAAAVALKGRRLIGIADPHLRADANYSVHADAASRGLLVRTAANDADFVGECWPGASGYVDTLNPAAREWWRRLYSAGGHSDGAASTAGEGEAAVDGRWPTWMHAWNDMNEPSVFDGPELTLPRDTLHNLGPAAGAGAGAAGGGDGADATVAPGSSAGPASARYVEHRLVHNAYGALQASATWKGLEDRATERPFLLSRAFFIGSARHGAAWTGDNSASWDHLRLAASMVLSLGISGMIFAGADVGGFFGDPDPELLVRWYQLGAIQPFYRSHAHLDSPRREPWMLPTPEADAAVGAIRERQRLLPYWNTLWWAASGGIPDQAGLPITRPLWLLETGAVAQGGGGGGGQLARELLECDDTWTIGDALLARPVLERAQRRVRVFLPAGALWYNTRGGKPSEGGEHTTADAPLHVTPTWQRGGSIVPRRETTRRSALAARWDPITLHVAPGSTGAAAGRLVLDDGLTRGQDPAGGPSLRLELAFACEPHSQPGARCTLRSTATGVPLARHVHVEAVLIRGMAPRGGAATWRVHTAAGPGEGHAATVEAVAEGVLVGRMRAPCEESWTLELEAHSPQ